MHFNSVQLKLTSQLLGHFLQMGQVRWWHYANSYILYNRQQMIWLCAQQGTAADRRYVAVKLLPVDQS